MNHRSKFKMQNYTISRLQHRRKSRGPWVWQSAFSYNTKIMRKKTMIRETSQKIWLK